MADGSGYTRPMSMSAETSPNEERIPGFCALCRSRCGCISVVQDGRLVAVEPNPEHPTGQALCAKGRAVPEMVYSPDRLLHPMKRTAPKGAADPGWQRISWDEALDMTADALDRIRREDGAHAVAFSVTTPSGTAMGDAIPWVERLIRGFGSPNTVYGTEICNWHKDNATAFTSARASARRTTNEPAASSIGATTRTPPGWSTRNARRRPRRAAPSLSWSIPGAPAARSRPINGFGCGRAMTGRWHSRLPA